MVGGLSSSYALSERPGNMDNLAFDGLTALKSAVDSEKMSKSLGK